jgi:deoxyribodipyrimidine photo-lyase
MNIFWFRRDLRLEDNTGLYHALQSDDEVLPVFIFDENILSQLPKDDARVTFIHDQLNKIQNQLNKLGTSLAVFY